MKLFSNAKYIALILLISVMAWPLSTWGGDFPHPETYTPLWPDVDKTKRPTTNASLYEAYPYEKVLPPELYRAITYDPEKMSALTAEILGYKATDVTGKIAPEITPGYYSYRDLQTKPGLKELLPPYVVENYIKPGGEPFAANIPAFDIIPTQQWFWAIPVAEATKKNAGKTKQDDQGYIVTGSWESGCPFPRPEGKFNGIQYVYNHQRSYINWGLNYTSYSMNMAFTKKLDCDNNSFAQVNNARLGGRVYDNPYRFIDERAARSGEHYITSSFQTYPRDLAGTLSHQLFYLDPYKLDRLMVFIPAVRRVRVLSTSESQDPIPGYDTAYDDGYGISQKLSPENNPWKYTVLEEREYLLPVAYSGFQHLDKEEGYALKNISMERRPVAVVQLEQMDPNYVYSKKIFYIDREINRIIIMNSFNQKGALYRTSLWIHRFHPEFGTATLDFVVYRDYVDLHSTIAATWFVPSFWDRSDTGFKALVKRAK